MKIKYFKPVVKQAFTFQLVEYRTPIWGRNGKKIVQFCGFINGDTTQLYGLQPLQAIYENLWDKKTGDVFRITRLTQGQAGQSEAKFKFEPL